MQQDSVGQASPAALQVPAQMQAFLTVLREAMPNRPQRQEIVPGPYGPELAWATHERRVMHQAVNQGRLERGLPAIELAMVERADRMAAGHVDYSSKFSLYCAEIALDLYRF